MTELRKKNRAVLRLEFAKWWMLLGLRRMGFKFADRVIKLTEITEPSFFRDTIASFEGTFVDVGASNGHYILLAKNARHVVAFEPDPRFWGTLAPLGESGRCEIRHEAVSDKVGQVEFNLSAGLFGSRMGKRVIGRTYERVARPATTLDSLSIPEGPVLVKMDTEGAEHLILMGGREFIEKYHPTLLIEYHRNLRAVLRELSVHHYGYTGNTQRRMGWIKAEPARPA
ncbi:MAG TPA: FkbM family methyltransferase [Nitrososphaerales archaeon]|nr:FkbM family methyltransferase [Nitrososphaerales archaeon]HUK75228.1 FkbM family methyltransferase [Nitrososphaerales archaeon]